MNFKEYLDDTGRIYSFRLKTVVPLDDDHVGRIERTAAKYDPIWFGTVKKTIRQRHPLDFPEVQNAEVYILDMKFSLPASAYILQQDFRNALGIPEEFIRVRGANDPLDIETDEINAVHDIDAEARKDGMVSAALLTLPDYPETDKTPGSDFYGNGHTARFLDYLGDIAKERKSMKVDAPHPHIRWADMPKDETTNRDDFNKDIKDATPAASNRTAKPVPAASTAITRSKVGNFDSQGKTVRRAFTTGNETVILKRELDALRKEGK